MTADSIPERSEAARDEDERSMAAIAAGDGDALREIFDRWKLPMLNYLYRSLGNFADAEDLALEVFTEVWRSAPRYRSEGTFSAWLFAIARGKVRHEWRRRRRKPVAAAPAEFLQLPAPAGEDGLEQRESEEVLLRGLHTLPEAQRSALILSAQSPLSADEVAATLGVKPSHLYVLIHRGRQRLRQYLKDQHEYTSSQI